jgi:two-component system CheB/CheR fusion protein
LIKKIEISAIDVRKRANYIVAIGASAGGVEALIEFFKAVPRETGIGYVVIQHLSPTYKSHMDEILALYTDMRIQKADENILVEADTIYLNTANTNLFIVKGRFITEDRDLRIGIKHPIDLFFQSLACDAGSNAIGIILSGAGEDGTLGIRAIKIAGGLVMAQEESTAQFYFMPRSAIETGLIDHILAPDKMAEELVSYIRHLTGT